MGRGVGGQPPATVTILSGDVHTTYVAEVNLGDDAGSSRVFQIVCSPFRNPLTEHQRRVVKATGSRRTAAVFSFLARLAGVPRLTASWRYLSERSFDNSIGELSLDHAAAEVTIYAAMPDEATGGWLDPLYTHRLTG